MSSKHYPVTHDPSRTSRRTDSHTPATDAPREPASLPVLAVTVVGTAALPLTLAFPGVAVALAVIAVGALLARRG
jgi:hypothetical protein